MEVGPKKDARMTTQLKKIGEKNSLFIYVVFILSLFLGCGFGNSSDVKTPVTKSITEIFVSEDQESWNCVIKGNKPLTFTAINQIAPSGVLFYFPDTTLDIAEAIEVLPENGLLSSIQADEFGDEDTINSRISIVLKSDRPYRLSSEKDGLKVSFPKSR
jgi:hypothetical protein